MHATSHDRSSSPTSSIIVPVYNEKQNITPLIRHIRTAMNTRSYEIIFVDDNSPDKTIETIREYAKTDPKIHGILRINRKGLCTAATEGILAASADIIIVMDGDLQHDPKALPKLIAPLEEERASLSIASRYLQDGHHKGLDNHWRYFLSQTGNMIARHLCQVRVSDPMSGFFAIKRELFIRYLPHLYLGGFKLLFDILTLLPPSTHIVEIPTLFHKRHYGQSKLSAGVLFHFLMFFYFLFKRRVISALNRNNIKT